MHFDGLRLFDAEAKQLLADGQIRIKSEFAILCSTVSGAVLLVVC